MKYRGKQSFGKEPDFLVKFCGKEGNVYPFLANGTKRRINRSYDEQIDLNIPDKVIREAFPEEWQIFLLARRLARKARPDLVRGL